MWRLHRTFHLLALQKEVYLKDYVRAPAHRSLKFLVLTVSNEDAIEELDGRAAFIFLNELLRQAYCRIVEILRLYVLNK